MKVLVKRTEHVTGAGFQIVIGPRATAGRTIYCSDNAYGGTKRAKAAAEEIKRALEVLTEYFPNLTIKRNGFDPAADDRKAA